MYPGCRTGRACIVHSGAVIGADGFGFALEEGAWRKIPQIGRVRHRRRRRDRRQHHHRPRRAGRHRDRRRRQAGQPDPDRAQRAHRRAHGHRRLRRDRRQCADRQALHDRRRGQYLGHLDIADDVASMPPHAGHQIDPQGRAPTRGHRAPKTAEAGRRKWLRCAIWTRCANALRSLEQRTVNELEKQISSWISRKSCEYLPHRYPFLLIDRVIECELGKRIRALKNVSINEPYLPRPFPASPGDARGADRRGDGAGGGDPVVQAPWASSRTTSPSYYFAGIDRRAFQEAGHARRPVDSRR